MTLELARRLISGGAVVARDIEVALYLSVVRGVSFTRALVDRGVLGERALEEEMSRRAGLPLRQVHPALELVARLPSGMCRTLGAVPLRLDGSSGVVEIAAIDPLDKHLAIEFGFHLGAPIRVQRATLGAIEEAIRRLELDKGGAASRTRSRTPAFPHGAPDSAPPALDPASGVEDVPIPLVRKLAPASRDVSRGLPLESALSAVTRDWEEHAPPQVSAGFAAPDEESEVRGPPSRRGVLLEAAGGAPSVSFPSVQPPRIASVPPPVSESAVSSDRGGPPSGEPVTERQDPDPSPPRSLEAGWTPTLPELLDLIARETSRDTLLDLVLRSLTLIARRAAIFVVKKGSYLGWACNPALGAEEDLRMIGIPLEQPSIFATAAVTGYYVGAIPNTDGHRPLLELMGTASSEVVVHVAKVHKKPTVVLLVDDLDDPVIGRRALNEVSRRASDALTRIVEGRAGK